MQAASLTLQMLNLVHKHLGSSPGKTASLWEDSSEGVRVQITQQAIQYQEA